MLMILSIILELSQILCSFEPNVERNHQSSLNILHAQVYYFLYILGLLTPIIYPSAHKQFFVTYVIFHALGFPSLFPRYHIFGSSFYLFLGKMTPQVQHSVVIYFTTTGVFISHRIVHLMLGHIFPQRYLGVKPYYYLSTYVTTQISF